MNVHDQCRVQPGAAQVASTAPQSSEADCEDTFSSSP
eukprot:CAMPEP_0118941708 /NCGR_PEP_ID=MMETSP1169-20130426/34469_1 /TAXON_ID=36882 /ORGANISM="Pyramimonas obovata, Strain CCMP722" /LENGTH=36 /DNA_ID= /DNA_START= /DNA_END= /DNA_ORIENTATION=